ncbi:unnamed protein product [Tuber melanosporum]|uniref:(Perigord truffle) hypothetical protein n=1 Tax=Tuber melanosporum (strain Mel28) TaxID=656061 RepID=D5G667_TUBMM|nr:uncharacterized protein GSTUM_00001632001 [Tuber melanosporum]CAZ80010.1 unnamed protein product [Tuber melanosporum]
MHLAYTSCWAKGPMVDRILKEIWVPPQWWRGPHPGYRPLRRDAIIIDQEIEWVVENRVRQEPGAYGFIVFDEDIFCPRYRQLRRPAQLPTTFTSCAKNLTQETLLR